MRNPRWSREELILALDLYFREPAARGDKNHPEVLALSKLLNRLRGGDAGSSETFRNPNGVAMKLSNFLRFDPEYEGTGLKRGGRLEGVVWNEFEGSRRDLRVAASTLRDRFDSAGSLPEPEVGSEADLDVAMHDLYLETRSAVYNPAGFLGLLDEYGGLGAARHLLHSPKVSDGFSRLWEAGRLDLTVEHFILGPRWRNLFTAAEHAIAEKRLRQYGADPPTAAGLPRVLRSPDFEDLVNAVNALAVQYEVGKLQEIRTSLKELSRRPGSRIFSSQSLVPDIDHPFAFHHGGRRELQFNLGIEDYADGPYVRHGVAFSLEPSQSLPDPLGTLLPRVRRFNEYVELNDELARFTMWWWFGEERSDEFQVRPITPDLCEVGTFIFVGSRQPVAQVDLDQILSDFDDLLPLYEFVEGNSRFPRMEVRGASGDFFRPGHSSRLGGTTEVSQAERVLVVSHRHNEMQDQLYVELCDEHGPESVGTEVTTSTGTSVDLVVRTDTGFDFYEIKTALSPRACIRQALAQLLEYSYWPGHSRANRLVVVGEIDADSETRTYLEALRVTLSIPVYYQSVSGGRC